MIERVFKACFEAEPCKETLNCFVIGRRVLLLLAGWRFITGLPKVAFALFREDEIAKLGAQHEQAARAMVTVLQILFTADCVPIRWVSCRCIVRWLIICRRPV
jgi:hypothetical protein